MVGPAAFAGDDPQQSLRLARDLAHRVRTAQRATWFPLLVLAAATFGAVLVYRYSERAMTCRSVRIGNGLAGRVCSVYPTAAFVYWPIALTLAYVVIAAFYVSRSREHGVGTRVRPYVVAGIVIAVLLTAASLWSARHPPTDPRAFFGLDVGMQGFGVQNRLVSASCAIGLALLVLAWAERSRPVLGFAAVYLVVVLVPVDFGWTSRPSSPWHAAPHLIIDGTVLLVGAAGFAVAQRAAARRSVW